MKSQNSSATSTIKKSLSLKLMNYFSHKWLFQTNIGDEKIHVKIEIVSNRQIEEQERINSILDLAMKIIRGEKQLEIPADEKAKPVHNSKKKTKEKQQQNSEGDYTVIGAARYLGMGESTIRKYQTLEKINGYKVGNKRFYTKKELDNIKVTDKTNPEIEQELEDAIIEGKTGAKK